MSKFTIQDLANGKCAIMYDGALEDLKSVLGKAFPNDKRNVIGGDMFYFSDGNEGWDSDYTTDLPFQSVEDFDIE